MSEFHPDRSFIRAAGIRRRDPFAPRPPRVTSRPAGPGARQTGVDNHGISQGNEQTDPERCRLCLDLPTGLRSGLRSIDDKWTLPLANGPVFLSSSRPGAALVLARPLTSPGVGREAGADPDAPVYTAASWPSSLTRIRPRLHQLTLSQSRRPRSVRLAAPATRIGGQSSTASQAAMCAGC